VWQQPPDALTDSLRSTLRHDAAAAAAVLSPLALDAAALDALWRRSWGPCDARIEVSDAHSSSDPYAWLFVLKREPLDHTGYGLPKPS
jgi:hypothetical protein